MSWAETSKINSNFINEPLNFNNYINDISVFGSDSYVMDESNSDLWLEMMSKSLAVYGHDMIHEFLYERITEDDADFIVRNHPKLGQAFNSFYNISLFEHGSIDVMLSGITQEAWGLLEVKFQNALNKYISEKTSNTSVGSWLAEIFDVPELADYTSISDIFSDEDLYNDYIADNESLLFIIANSAIASVFVAETLAITNSKFQAFIESVAASIPATMQLITALKAYDKLDSFFANENCCDKIVESAQAMKAMLYSIDGFEAMLNSEIAMEKVADNETAVNLIIQAITDVANSSTALSNIKSVLPGISTNLESIPETEPMIEDVNNAVEIISDTLEELDKVLNKTDILAKNVDALFNSSVAMTAICNNTTAINKIANNRIVLAGIVKNNISKNIILNSNTAISALKMSTLTSHLYLTNQSSPWGTYDSVFNSILAIDGFARTTGSGSGTGTASAVINIANGTNINTIQTRLTENNSAYSGQTITNKVIKGYYTFSTPSSLYYKASGYNNVSATNTTFDLYYIKNL